MKKTLYLECYSGISGDMTVAALLDLGADEKVLRDALASLPLDGFTIAVSRVHKRGIDACDFDVKLAKDNHDHDMEYLHGHSHPHQEHKNHSASHVHRGLREIWEIIDQSALTSRAKKIARRIFEILARAESLAHGVPPEEVHFHEVGAVDSIVDILSVAVCLDNLKVDEVIISPLWEGHGTIRCQHGIIPVPVPAVANIARLYGLALHPTSVEGELVTPTGAAIAAAIGVQKPLPPSYRIAAIGLGAGKREYPATAGVLRAMILKSQEEEGKDLICKMETNLDDCTGEHLGYVMQLLMEAGAKDVYHTPIFMKKNRPGYQLTVLCSPKQRPLLEEIIFRETTSIGIRHILMERTILNREIVPLQTPLGQARVKVCTHGRETFVYPEYEDAARIAREKKLPLAAVMEEIRKAMDKEQETL